MCRHSADEVMEAMGVVGSGHSFDVAHKLLPLPSAALGTLFAAYSVEGHMHEHGPLYTSVPFVMFDEGGDGVVWCGGGGGGDTVERVVLAQFSKWVRSGGYVVNL